MATYITNQLIILRSCVILLLQCLLLSSCNEGVSQEIVQLTSNQYNPDTTIQNSCPEPTETLTTNYVPVSINSGAEHILMQFPSDWVFRNINEDRIVVESSEGIKVFNPVYQAFFDFKNKADNKKNQELGYDVQPEKDIDAIINSLLMPVADSANAKLTNRFTPEGIKSLTETYDELTIFNFQSEQTTVDIEATEWADDKNTRSLVVIERFAKTYGTNITWGFLMHNMDAPAEKYEAAKEIFLNSLRSFQPCYKAIFDENKRAIRSITQNYTAQYFTIAQEKQRREAIYLEQERTGTFEHDSFEKYILKLKERGLLLNASTVESCQEIHLPILSEYDYHKPIYYSHPEDEVGYSPDDPWKPFSEN